MIRLALLRHGPTDWNKEHRLQGRSDIPLSDEGREEVTGRRLPEELYAFRWYCSPLVRARETAAVMGIHGEMALDMVEMSWGEWEGERLADLRSKHAEVMAAQEARGLDLMPPGGESPRQVQERVLPWLQRLTEDTGVVTHKGVIRALYALATGWDMTGKPEHKLNWRAVHLFTFEDGTLQIDKLNLDLEAT
ncbi:MAG: histidine phosphatase family protein [Pseudomonadota bacterium]